MRLLEQIKSYFIIKHDAPASGMIVSVLARCIMSICGWKTTGKIPPGTKFILIGEPHTSNWDFLLMFGVAWSKRIEVSWIGKNTIFKKPFGTIMRKLGGIPLDRSSRHNVVVQTAEMFKKTAKLIVVIGPSGTRRKREYWKSGFYWIAHKAQIPILCGYLDFENKTVHVGLSFVPTGNVKKDMDRIREFYKDIRGQHPELETPIRLENEDS
jgi:acyltransferase-like protein